MLKHCITKLGKLRQKENPIKKIEGWCRKTEFLSKGICRPIFSKFYRPACKISTECNTSYFC